MKKAAVILAALFLSFSPVARSAREYVSYAYLDYGAVLFDSSGAPVCTLPATYFVTQCGNEESGKLPVSYLDLSGYVLSSAVSLVDYEPVTKFHTASARVSNDGLPVNLRTLPDPAAGEVIATVPAGEALFLYGEREGTELFSGAGRSWRFVRYDSPSGEIKRGYVYSAQLDCDEVPPNVVEKVEHTVSPDIEETPADTEPGKIAKMLLIAALTVPAGVIMLIVFYRPDSERTPRHRRDG